MKRLFAPLQRGFAFTFFALLPVTASAQYTVHTLLDNGPSDRRMHLVLFSEGYRDEELPRFVEDATKVMNDFFAEAPFREYKSYFNVLAVAVASKDSGIDVPSLGLYRDTYFDMSYECGGMAVCVMWPSDRLYNVQQALLDERGWLDPLTMVLVNDTTYDAGSSYITTRGTMEFVHVTHELGHQFALLNDEYDDQGRGGTEGKNTTAETRREHVKWRHWFEEHTPIPTPYDTVYFDQVGLFEGALEPRGWFRPQAQCKMRWSEHPFCAVCREHIIGVINEPPAWSNRLRRIRHFLPADTVQTLLPGGTLELRLDAPQPEHGLSLTWSVNGVRVAEGQTTFPVRAAEIGPGQHVVELRVADETPYVRDPQILPQMQQTHRWRLTIPQETAGEEAPGAPALALGPIYPNPMHEATMIPFTLPQAGTVRLLIYDVLGREVARVAEGSFPAGQHQARWHPDAPAPGVYFVAIETAGQRLMQRFVVTR